MVVYGINGKLIRLTYVTQMLARKEISKSNNINSQFLERSMKMAEYSGVEFDHPLGYNPEISKVTTSFASRFKLIRATQFRLHGIQPAI